MTITAAPVTHFRLLACILSGIQNRPSNSFSFSQLDLVVKTLSYHRDGFEVIIPASSHPRLDPVRALKCYISRTRYVREYPELALFLSLKKPYGAVSAATITRILETAIEMAGLGNQGFKAKHFRPTGATIAVEAGIKADTIRRVGRWKSRETFEAHYVHAVPPTSFTDSVFKRVIKKN